jgi:cytochrome d ubiquinol oxidase subunit I
MLAVTLTLLTILVPLQIFLGDAHGLNTIEYQPAKLAAIEAHWNTGRRVGLNLFAIPDEKAETNRYELSVPDLGSLILTHDPNGIVRGLKDWPADQRPPVAIPFFAFRIMVGIGVLMLTLLVASWWLRARRRLFDANWFSWICMLASPLGFLAVLAGWTTTEVGRQPWTVYGLLRTTDSVSASLSSFDVMLSLVGYGVVYLIMFPFGIAVMARIVGNGPVEPPIEPNPVEAGRPQRPVEALPSSAGAVSS